MGSEGSAAVFSPVVIAPTFNNAATVVGVLERIGALGLPVIVADDGCTDGTAPLLAAWSEARGGHTGGAMIETHPRNRGKAAALMTGFEAAFAAGYTHAVSIDTDGQLDPESIPPLLEAARRAPGALVLGARSDHIEGCPARSLLGRRLSNAAIRRECGVKLVDSQCGLRVYPLDLVAPGSARAVRCREGRYGFEAEVITRAAWAGREIVQAPVPCRYLPPAQRVSHFRPWRDSVHGVLLHARLLARALVRVQRSGPGLAEVRDERLIRRLRLWVSPARVWAQIRDDDGDRGEVALGVGIGVFIANLPAYGVQTLLGLLAARQLHLHPLPVVAGTQVSTPPIGIALVAAAVALGHRILHGEWIWLHGESLVEMGLWRLAGTTLLDWLVGSIPMGILTGVGAFFLTAGVLRLLPRRATPR